MSDIQFMRLALRLARRGYGCTSPNPMVGAVLVKRGQVIGRGWHRCAGMPHAEIEALRDAAKRSHSSKGATLYVTLEPCSTHGRTPPCTEAIIAAGVKRVVIGATDPNPKHEGKGFRLLRRAGIEVTHGILANEWTRLNEAFNHWIVRSTPFVTVKAAMTLDGKIATASGESKWITGEKARAYGMRLRQGSDAILVGVNTISADNPSLTFRNEGNIQHPTPINREQAFNTQHSRLRRIVLDSMARTPLTARVVSDEHAGLTTIVVSNHAPKPRVVALTKQVSVLFAPTTKVRQAAPCPPRRARSAALHQQIDLRWLLKKLGAGNVTSLLVEGGGEVNASFLMGGFAQRVAFFYAPKVLGGRDSRRAVAGDGATSLTEVLKLSEVEWRKLGPDLLLTGLVASRTHP